MFHDEKLMRNKRVRGLWREANRLADDEEDIYPMPSICNTLRHLINREHVNPTDCLSLRTSSMLLSGAALAYKKKVQSLFADTEKLDKDVTHRNRHRNPDWNFSSATDTESKSESSIRNEENLSVTTDHEPETMMRMEREPLNFDVSPISSQHKRKSSIEPFVCDSLKKPRLQRLSLTPRYSSSNSEHLLRCTRSRSSETLGPGSPRSKTTFETDPEHHQNFPEQNPVSDLPGSLNSPDKHMVLYLQSDEEVTSANEGEQSEGIQTNSSRSQVAPPTSPSSEHIEHNSRHTTPTREPSLSLEDLEQTNTKTTLSQEHETPSRNHIGIQITPSTEHIGTQTALTRNHVSTQVTPPRNHIGTQNTPSTRHQGTQTGFPVPPEVRLPFAQVFIFAASKVEPCLMIEGQLSDFDSDSDEDEKCY